MLVAGKGLGKIPVEHPLITWLPGKRDDAIDEMENRGLAHRAGEEGHRQRMPHQLSKTHIVGDERSTHAPLATFPQDCRICLGTLLLPHTIKSLAQVVDCRCWQDLLDGCIAADIEFLNNTVEIIC